MTKQLPRQEEFIERLRKVIQNEDARFCFGEILRRLGYGMYINFQNLPESAPLHNFANSLLEDIRKADHVWAIDVAKRARDWME